MKDVRPRLISEILSLSLSPNLPPFVSFGHAVSQRHHLHLRHWLLVRSHSRAGAVDMVHLRLVGEGG